MATLRLSQILKKRFIGTEELRRELSDIIEDLTNKRGEIIVMQRGKPKIVIQDLESYLEREEFEEQVADSDPKLINHINKIAKGVKSGKVKLIPAETVLKRLGVQNV